MAKQSAPPVVLCAAAIIELAELVGQENAPKVALLKARLARVLRRHPNIDVRQDDMEFDDGDET